MNKDNTVFTENKSVMNYGLAVVTQFSNRATEVIIKARGKAIRGPSTPGISPRTGSLKK